MLVLSRRIDERIMIGNDIVITVLEIHHDHVRIGIDAPRSIDV
ncbi:MAG TPA: carbon storage regulator, partial [Acidimicrobiales bacterium]|nr:carbon storage regulator [Acidimicrobiales bacterium]